MTANFLLHIEEEDVPYLPFVKQIVGGRGKVHLSTAKPETLTEIIMTAKEKKVTKVASTSPLLLKLLVKKPSAKNSYAGSMIEVGGIEFLLLNKLEHLVTTSAGPFLYRRYLDKFLEEESWMQFPSFSWQQFHPRNTDTLIDICAGASFIAIDIETGREEDRVITCVGFTAVTLADGEIAQTTFVVPFLPQGEGEDEEASAYNRAFIKVICQCPALKVFQNGKYDNAYLLRFGIPVYNWGADTQHLFHCWYAEFPKRLDFLTSFLVRKWQFWKDEANTGNLYDYYQYNAKDSYITAMCWLVLLRESPSYAWNNYYREFPLVFPCLLTELTGLRRDNEAMQKEEKRFEAALEIQLQKIRKMVGNAYFNPNSPKQNLLLMRALGSGDIESSGKIALDKVKHRHPMNMRIFNGIQSFREDSKLTGTYLRDADPKTGELKSWNGRIFYSLNPHGTDTGRLASKESAFWCGWQIQNIPRDRDDIQVKSGILADPDFYFGECDRSQAEARDTAYLAGDTKLIEAVEDKSKDFHGLNASSFFGIPYSDIVKSIYDLETGEWSHTTLNKAVRQVSKNTNHGANYNMGAKVMLDTMGISAVVRAQKLLKLPSQWSLVQVCQYLLDAYDKTYPVVRGGYYEKIKSDVASSNLLVGPTGWTRYCFGNPSKNKRDMNAYAAHCGQSLNAMELNVAYMRVFYEVALKEPKDFKLGPQIHDSILFQYRKGRLDLAFKVRDCMINPIKVTDIFGITRELIVPLDLKGEAERWSDLKVLKESMRLSQQKKVKEESFIL